MSTALAIASVTQVLKDLLNNGLIDHDITGSTGGNVTVTSLPPDKIDTTATEQTQLNLFMFHVTNNSGWRNDRYPSLNSSGDRVNNPPLALDLHYLLTAYGSNELHMEILLGYGMQILHENPVLVRDAIRKSLALPSDVNGAGLPVSLQSLATSKLADQVEQVKLTPENMNAEEMSKLWTAFQAKYRPTAAYMATVVLIESTKSTKSALPVKARNIYVKPFRQPVIEKLRSKVNAAAPIIENQRILKDYQLVIGGYNLKVDNTRINIDGADIEPAVTDSVTDTQIIFQLPTDLPAGIHGIQVNSLYNMGTPETLHRGVESNIEAFVLSPTINTSNAANISGGGDAPRSADIELNISPAVEQPQRVLLLLNEINIPPGTVPEAYSFFFSLPIDSAPLQDIVIPISGVKTGVYLVRIQVDGAESPLGTAGDGKYNSPVVKIT